MRILAGYLLISREGVVKIGMLLRLCVISSCLLFTANVGAQTKAEWKEELRLAREQLVTGDRIGAINQYEHAIHVSPAGQAKAEILMELGDVYGRDQLEESAKVFCMAMAHAPGEIRLQAGNNCASQTFRLGRSYEALDLMHDLWSEFRAVSLTPVARSRFLYNYARMLEVRDGPNLISEEYYRLSFDADPSFRPASEKVADFALNSQSESMGIPELIGLINGLIQAGDFKRAFEEVKHGLNVDHWQWHKEYPRLVTQFVRLLTVAQVAPEQYESEWLGQLPQVSNLKDIDKIYTGQIQTDFDSIRVREKYDRWNRTGGFTALSRMMKMLGDHYFRLKYNGDAFRYYTNAWVIDKTNMDAGLYAANLIASDKGIARDYLDDFLEFAFGAKGNAYLGRDWTNIFGFHVVLGTLFEEMKNWGSESNPRSAIFQWQHALIANEEISRREPSSAHPTHYIQEHLATSFAGANRWQNAWISYLASADEYIKHQKFDDARRVLEDAQKILQKPNISLPPEPNKEIEARLGKLEK